ncbi:hypothetical protein VPH35_130010 [Triticum aestivum]
MAQPEDRIIAGIFIGIVASLLVSIIVCSLCRGHRNGAADRSRQLRQACAAGATAGLPAFTYSLSVKHNMTGGGEEAATCSVCLGALQLGDTVRLLPTCPHVYHAECIDPWLGARSTCPICRSDTNPATGVGQLPPA